MAALGTNLFPDTDDSWSGAAGVAYDVYADPIATNPTTDPDHADQHSKVNRALTKVEKRILALGVKDQVLTTRTTTAAAPAGGTLTRTVLSLTIPANKAFVGMQLHWEAYGSLDLTAVSQSITAKAAYGPQALGSYTFLTPANIGGAAYPQSAIPWVMRGTLVMIALGAPGTGSARAAFDGWFQASHATTPLPFVSIQGNATAIDTTSSQDFVVSITFPNTAAVATVFNAARVSLGILRLDRAS